MPLGLTHLLLSCGGSTEPALRLATPLTQEATLNPEQAQFDAENPLARTFGANAVFARWNHDVIFGHLRATQECQNPGANC